jgi:CheY-like chemotaxis protein
MDGTMAPQSVLVVDDSRDAADALALAFELLDCRVALAYDGPSALRQLDEFAPDLMVLDLSMPGMDGFTLARAIRQRPGLEKVLMVALSGFGRDIDRQHSKEAGFDLHLLKPVEFQELQRLLERAASS